MQRFKQIGVAIFTLIFAILTPLSVFAESGTVTSARQIFLGGGSSTWSFTVDDGQGNMDGACVDPTNMSIPLGGQTANLERLDNSSHLAKLAYLAKDEFTTDVQQYAVGRAGARILGLTEYNHYNYSNVVNSIYDRAKSVTVPVGFEAWLVRPTNGSQMILSWRYSPVGYVKLFKQVDDSSGIISKYPSAYSRAGAVYGVYSSSSLSGSSRVGTLTTTASGNSNVLSLNAGTYYVKEITPSKGFKLDPNTYTATVVSGQTKTISSIEPPEFGKAYVKKTVAKNKHLTDLCPEQYSLAGAEFLLTNIENPNVSAKLITDNNGVSEIQQLVAGTYSVKETKAPKGYKINRNIPNITVTDGKTTEINVADEPLFDPLSLKVQKKAEEGADKNISLEGAEYTVKYYKEYLSKEQVEAGVKPFRTWTFRTDKNGIFQYRDKWKIGGGELFKLASGIPAGLMGTYAVYETKAPKGFAKTDGIISLQHVKVDNTFENVTVMKDATDIEKIQKVNIQIQKVDAETGNPLPQGYGSFKGAEFSVWYFDAREGKDIKAGDVVTDENGFASLDAQTPGLYTLREEKAPAGYVTNKKEVKVEARIKEINTAFFDYKSEVPEKPITVEITKSSINEKGEKVSVKGAVLALFTKDGRKLEEWTTDGKAHILKALPKGEYVIKELKTPKGYLPLEEDFRFTVKETEDVQKKDVFNEPIPELKTKALFDTEIPNSLNKDKVKLIDTVRYDKVLKDHLYTLKGEVLNRETGKVVAKGETKFIPKNANGEAKVEYTFNAKDLKGATLVVTERLFRDDRKTEDKKVAEHIDLMDSQQTVYIPKLETLAYDKKDGGKDFLGRDKQVLVDEVRYSNLKPEREYTVKGVLMDSKTGKSLGIKAEKTFTAGAENGLVKIEYTFLADKLDGISPVVFEELYDGKTLIAEHKDQFDLKQTVHSPKIRTKATDKVDGGKDVFAKGEQTVVDTVKYSNLIVGKTYTVKGILMDQETGKPIVDGGKEVKAEKTFTAEKKDGTIDLEFIIKDSKALEGKTTIVFENLYRDKKLVGVHEEIKDKDQSVYFPKVRTKGFDKLDNDKDVLASGKQTVIDTVSLENLLAGEKYTVSGIVMDKETSKPLLVNGKEVTGKTEFTAKGKNESVKVEYVFEETADLAGKDIVLFEKLHRGDKLVGLHEDINDKDQTVHFAKVKTTAYDKVDKEKDLLAKDKQIVVDTVKYSNLIIGKTYTVKGVLMDKETGKPLLVNGAEVKADKTFTAEKKDGTIDLEFIIKDSKALEGKTFVAFEDIYRGSKLIGFHREITDKEQTIDVPKIRTKATDKVDGGKDVFAKGEQTVVDTVKYSNLIVGKTYTVKGILMDQETGKPIVDGGKEVKAEKTFTAEKKDGTIDLEFIIKDSKALEGKTTIVFENLYRDKKLVGVHEEIKDKDQSVYFPKVRTKANINGKEKAVENKDMKITDVVSYSNLIVGKKYTVKGVLMDKSAGKPLLINGSEVRAEKTFTAEKKDGTTTLEFIFDGTGYGNKEVVVFEKMYRGDKLIGQHEDINDKDQTVKIVKIGTIEITDKDKFKRWGSVFTGDNNNLYLYALALLVSGSFIVIVRRKKNK